MSISLHRLLVVPLAALLVAAPTTLADESAPTVTADAGARATLAARVMVTVPVTVTCDPLTPVPATESSIGVSVTQAVVHGSRIATGVGSFGQSPLDVHNPLLCDGLPHAYAVPVFANPQGPPFRVGLALVRVAALVCPTSQFSGCVSGHSSRTVRFVRSA